MDVKTFIVQLSRSIKDLLPAKHATPINACIATQPIIKISYFTPETQCFTDANSRSPTLTSSLLFDNILEIVRHSFGLSLSKFEKHEKTHPFNNFSTKRCFVQNCQRPGWHYCKHRKPARMGTYRLRLCRILLLSRHGCLLQRPRTTVRLLRPRQLDQFLLTARVL